MFLTNILLMLQLPVNSLLDTLKIIFMIFYLELIYVPFFLNPTEEIKVKNIILSLNLSKATGPNSIPTKIF